MVEQVEERRIADDAALAVDVHGLGAPKVRAVARGDLGRGESVDGVGVARDLGGVERVLDDQLAAATGAVGVRGGEPERGEWRRT